jgi:hypothetical protein
MEFTYRISEQEYLEAARLNRKSGLGSSLRKVLFGVFLMLCLLLLFAVFMKIRSEHPDNVLETANHIASITLVPLLKQDAPGLAMVALAVLFAIFWPRIRLQRMYRKLPALNGEVKALATAELFSVQSSTGSTSTTRWTDISTWCESDGLILLIHPSRIYQIVNVRQLPDRQQSEFLELLATALPPKK